MAVYPVTKKNFGSFINKNEIVVLDFWASWCGPCLAFAPIFEAASEKHPDIVFGKIDTEAEEELAAMVGITSIPTIMVFRQQAGVFATVGGLSPTRLEEVIADVRAMDMPPAKASV